MNLQERQSLPVLWLYSFSVALRALPKLLLVGLGYLVVGFVVKKIIKAVIPTVAEFFIRSLVGVGASEWTLIIHVIGFLLIAWACWQLYVKFFTTVGARIAGQIAENQKASIVENSFDSVVPSFYALISSIIRALPFLLSLIPIYYLMKTFFLRQQITDPMAFMMALHQMVPAVSLFVFFWSIVLFFILYIRWTYAQALIMLKNAGPIEGLIESWNMTKGMKYLDTLLFWVLLVVNVIVYQIVFLVAFVVLYQAIPLYFASLFDVSRTWIGWIILGGVGALVAYFAFIQVGSFLFTTFLNRYYTNDGGAFNNKAGARKPVDFTPDSVLPNLQPVEVPETHMAEGLPPSAGAATHNQQEAQFQPAQPQPLQEDPAEITGMMPLGSVTAKPEGQPAPKPAPQNKPAPKPQQVATNQDDNLQLSQSTVNASAGANPEIDKHLDKVYTPSKDNVVQHGDEDRMPTILFDDEMAKQLEKSSQQFAANKQQQSDEPQDPGSVKISK